MTINNTQGTKCRIFTTLIILLIGIIVGNTFTSCSSDSDDDGDKGGNGTVSSSSSSDNGVVSGGSSSSGGGGGSSGSGTPFESEYTQEAFPQLTNASEFVGDWKSGNYTVTLESSGSWAMKLAGVTVGSYSGRFLVSGNTAYFYAIDAGVYYLNGYGTKSGNTMSMDGGFEVLGESWTKQENQIPTTPGRGEKIGEIYRNGSFEGALGCGDEHDGGLLYVDFYVTEDEIRWDLGNRVDSVEDDCTDNLPRTGKFEDASTSGGGALTILGINWGIWSYIYSGDNMIGIVYIEADDDDLHFTDGEINFAIGKESAATMAEALAVFGFNGNVSEISEDVWEISFTNE